MYADRMSAGAKRSARDRLHGNPDSDHAPSPLLPAKRQRQSNDRWKHDLYERPQVSNLKVGPRDLRLKLQKKVLQETHQIGNAVQGVKYLREKLSGTMHSEPAKADPPRVKVVAEPIKLAKKSLVDVPARAQNVANSSLSKKTQPKPIGSHICQNLGCTRKHGSNCAHGSYLCSRETCVLHPNDCPSTVECHSKSWLLRGLLDLSIFGWMWSTFRKHCKLYWSAWKWFSFLSFKRAGMTQ